jgi:putative SOS response-associated peptidase YedK
MCRAFAADLDWDDIAEHFGVTGVAAIGNGDADADSTIASLAKVDDASRKSHDKTFNTTFNADATVSSATVGKAAPIRTSHVAAVLPSPTFHATPKTDIVVVAGDSHGRRHLRAAYWSLIPRSSQTIDLSYPTYNARIETAASKPTYAPSAASMRAVIPASGYYEFKGEHPFYFHFPDDVPLFMAGLYSWWRANAHSPWRLTATILTRDAVGALASVHNRMPVLLSDDMLDDWFAPLVTAADTGTHADAASLPTAANDATASLLAAANNAGGKLSQRLAFHEVAPLRGDGPQLIEPAPSWRQGSGLFD